MQTVMEFRRLGVVLLASALPVAGLGCEDGPVINRLPQPPVQIDVLSQKPAALVDILWVVDNSGTMVEEQAALATNFDRFITGLTNCQGTGAENDVCDFETKTCAVSGAPCNPPDYHIGVISTDVRSAFDQGKLRNVGLCTTAAGASPSSDKYRYCLSNNAECAHDPNLPSSDPANSVCDMSQAIPFVSATTPGAPEAFARAVRVGTSGSGRETGIEAAARALGRNADRSSGQFQAPPTENQGFLRPDASLFVIFVSDEDDSSFGQPTYFYRAFETLKGAGNEGLVSMSAIVGDPDADGASGPEPGGCEVTEDDGEIVRNAAGTRYVALSMYSRGLSAEFRVCDDKRLLCPSGEACQAPVEGLPGVCVPAGQCAMDADCGNFQCSGDRGCISCVQGSCQTEPDLFLELLERNGVFGSICAPDYGRVLSALGFEAAGLARKFPLTQAPDCNAQPIKCCAANVSDEACNEEAPICVRVDGEPVPNNRGSGWVYDGGSNAVFFDGDLVPPSKAEVQVSYTVGATNEACRNRLQ